MLDFFTDLYYYKKAYLIGEDCIGHAVNKITKPYEDRIETINSVKKLIDLLIEAKNTILKHIPENVLSEGEWTGIGYVNYDKYTRRNYGTIWYNKKVTSGLFCPKMGLKIAQLNCKNVNSAYNYSQFCK